MACFAAVGCSSPQNTGTNDPSDDGGTDVPAPEGNGDTGDGGETPAPAPKGPKAPDFTLKTLDGGEITLSDLEGKVVLVDFWSTTCDPCLAEMPELVKLYEAKKDEGFEILAVTVDGPETAAKVPATVKKNNMTFPILLDEDTEAMDRYNPKGEMPFTAVIDKRGHIVMKRAGYQPGDEASWKTLVDAVDGALAAK
jgi:peroxiredoxin